MQGAESSAMESRRLSPDEIPAAIMAPPLWSISEGTWPGVVVQRFRRSPGEADLSAIRDNIIVLNLSGPTLIEEIDHAGVGRKRWADKGHISLLPAGSRVLRKISGTADIALIHIDPSMVRQVSGEVFGETWDEPSLNPQLAVPDETITRLGILLLGEAEGCGRAAGAALAAELIVRTMIIHLLRRYSGLEPQAQPEPAGIPKGRLKRVLRHMRASLDEPMTLADLAKVSGCSASWFAKGFKQAIGESPHSYLTGLRISHAQDLLENTRLSIIQVGLECGFPQSTHFATAFRKRTGMSPRLWRHARNA